MIKVNDVVMLKSRAGGSAPAMAVTVLAIKEFAPGRQAAYVMPLNNGDTWHVPMSDLEEIPVS